MFSKRNQLDIKKSTSKIQDPKKDLATKIKHLKIILDNVDVSEAKGFFEANFSHVFNILYDSFIQAEYNLRQRELSFHLVHKAHKEELECALWILEQVLGLLPELIHKRWQMHSLGRILNKLLHPGNSVKLRRQGIRYFLMWYQALNENAADYVDGMYASLVPGFINPSVVTVQPTGGLTVYHDTTFYQPVTPGELLPILPPSTSEKPPDHPSKLFLEALLEHMVQSVVKLEWHDKTAHYHQCFHFLLERFKIYYLPKICPNFSAETSLYKPTLELPVLRRVEIENEFVYCRVTILMWITNYVHQTKKNVAENAFSQSGQHSLKEHEDDATQHDSAHPSLDSNLSLQINRLGSQTDEDLAAQIVRQVLYSSRDNVNFLHELFRQAFLLNFNHVIAIRKTIQVYKDLIQLNVPEIPPYMLELPDDMRLSEEVGQETAGRCSRLRNDSYLGAIHKENLLVRAGMQNVLQLFMTHAANVFLLEVNQHIPKILEEQTDACKRVLSIYRYMVMNTRMDNSTWEQLLLVLLQITSLILVESPPKKKMQTLGGKLAPAIFQTLIVTWIKANLNVTISQELWDRFLEVLVSLTNWEDLIKEWAKTMDTLNRLLARHVYKLDLTDLPLDRLAESKSKRMGRRPVSRPESCVPRQSFDNNHPVVSRQDSTVIEVTRKRRRSTIARCSSETDLYERKRNSHRPKNVKNRRSLSLDNLVPHDTESIDRSRSPSPAPSSGVECNSIKDSPLQLDMVTEHHQHHPESPSIGEHTGVVCGGTVRGWLPDVAVILWRRMLGALGDVNDISDSKLHHQVFQYLIKLTDTLIKIKDNQGVSQDNLSTPQPPELVPPLTLIIPWCFGALMLDETYEAGKLDALRLLCTITLNCDPNHRTYLPEFYYFLHIALTDPSKPYLNITLKYLGPRFLSLQLPGSSMLLLDLIHACNTVLNSTDSLETSPRTEAVSIMANLLTEPHNVKSLYVLQPENEIHFMPCPDIKEHVVSILLRAGRREAKGKARCIALSSLGIYVYKELSNKTFHSKITDAIEVILQSLRFNNKVIAQLASNILFLLCDHAVLLWKQYPKHGNAIIGTLCSALFAHAPLGSTASETDKALGTALLLCLGEWCMKLGPKRLLEMQQYGQNEQKSLLLQVFTVLFKIVTGRAANEHPGGLSQPSMQDDFDPNILSDDLNKRSSPVSSPSKHQNCQRAITLCAKTVLAHLVTHLGHFPMAIGAARLSSLVVEHDDVPNLPSDELSTSIFSAPNIQLFMLNPDVISSFVELPTLDLPGGGVTAGLSTASTQVRVLLRDLSGKASWDASNLYKNPDSDIVCMEDEMIPKQRTFEVELSHQPESMIVGNVQRTLPQRAMRHRSPNVLPDVSNSAPDLDQLNDLLQYIGHTSPECLESPYRKLNEPGESPVCLELEQEAIASVINQRNVEMDEYRFTSHSISMVAPPTTRPDSKLAQNLSAQITSLQQASIGVVEQKAFQQCRLLFSQLGLAGWDKRQQLHLLNKTERLLRELRNLDGQCCRETHKVAVIYVAQGQEDKNSILSNQTGSVFYEQFLAALAWEIELENHTGFLGGLQRGGSNGLSAPYYATSFLEVIFHVATRMPGDTPEAVLNKIRHLGNDEVHIVWSEHNRDYRRDIIPTEFCDILIIIYPLGNNLHRVTVNCKQDVPHFGILFDEAIVETNILAGLVRATVICASRAKRTTLAHYQQYYEERARSLQTVVTEHRASTIYEEFISRVYSPQCSTLPFSNNSSLSGRSTSSLGSSSTLAAALIDSNRSSQKLSDPKTRNSDVSKGVWFINTDVESTTHSPRPSKKIMTSLKNVPKKIHKQESVETPPESPQQMIRKK